MPLRRTERGTSAGYWRTKLIKQIMRKCQSFVRMGYVTSLVCRNGKVTNVAEKVSFKLHREHAGEERRFVKFLVKGQLLRLASAMCRRQSEPRPRHRNPSPFAKAVQPAFREE
jgi:hypothetical protein